MSCTLAARVAACSAVFWRSWGPGVDPLACVLLLWRWPDLARSLPGITCLLGQLPLKDSASAHVLRSSGLNEVTRRLRLVQCTKQLWGAKYFFFLFFCFFASACFQEAVLCTDLLYDFVVCCEFPVAVSQLEGVQQLDNYSWNSIVVGK